MAQQKFFEIWAEGAFDPSHIKTTIVPEGSSLKHTPESVQFLEQAWAAHVAKGNNPWPNDLKPTRYRTAGISVENNVLHVTLDPCVRYCDAIGSRLPEFAVFGQDFLPRPTAVSAVIITNDNKILYTVRKKADYKKGGYHASIGGFMEIKKESSPTDAALREVLEETGIAGSDIGSMLCLGYVYNPWTQHGDLVYVIYTTLSASQVLAKKHDDENEIRFIEADDHGFEKLILGFPHANVIVAMAGPLMLGTQMFGRKWRRQMEAGLAEASADYESEVVRDFLEGHDIAKFQQFIQGQ